MSDIAGSNGGKTVTAKPYSGTQAQPRPQLKVAATPKPKPPAITERDLLQLSQLWQSTLDVHTLLEKLTAELPKFVPYDSFTYYYLEQALGAAYRPRRQTQLQLQTGTQWQQPRPVGINPQQALFGR